MSFDTSRFSFDPKRDFNRVVKLQGRVHLDSEFNEWAAILARRIQAGTMDTLGRAVVPATTPFGFKIGVSGNHLTIGAGRIYVDGLLGENHALLKQAQWDPSLSELSGAPQAPAPGATEVDLDFTQQPYLPAAVLPSGNGPFLVYVDVWQRDVTHLQQPDIIEKAIGFETTGRVQTVWQVKLLDVSGVAGGVTCSTPDASIPLWEALIQPPASRLTTGAAQSGTPGPCCLTPNTGFTGRENQNFCVHIHQGGGANASGTAPSPAATFKYSRDNASVGTAVTAIGPATTKSGAIATSQLTVESTGRDNVLGFTPGDWIEITDDIRELNGQAGDLRQIDVDGVDKANKTISLSKPVSTDIQTNLTNPPSNYPNCHTRIRRWDQKGKIYQSDGTTVWVDLNGPNSQGDIPIPPKGTTLILEDGVTVSFDLAASGGSFRVAEYWTFAARISDGSVEPLVDAPPMGIHHHYARLAVVTFPNPPIDCRVLWPPAAQGETCGCAVCVDVADFDKDHNAIAKAINKVNSMGGGRVCLGPGTFALGTNRVTLAEIRNVILSGQGPATILAYVGAGAAVAVDKCGALRIEDLSIIALPGADVQDIPVGLSVSNSGMLAVARCCIQAPAMFGPIVQWAPTAVTHAGLTGARGAAVVLDGFIVAATFRDNMLIADLGIVTRAALAAAANTHGAAAPAPLPPLALAACNVHDNLMLCPIAGLVLGDATPQQGLYVYLQENAIDGNTLLGGQFAGIFVEGFTYPGASVRISRNDLEVKNIGIDARVDGVIIADNVVTQADFATNLPGGAGKTGVGIAVRGLPGPKLSPFMARVHRNRIVDIAGPGILLDVAGATISVMDNAIQGAIGYGIGTTGHVAADLLVGGNNINNVTGAGVIGIYALALNATVQDNAVASIGKGLGEGGTGAGIGLVGSNVTAAGNHIRDIGPTNTSAPAIFGIYAGAINDLDVCANVVQQASEPAPADFVGNFIGIKVDETSLGTSVAVSLQGNTIEAASQLPLIEISDQAARTADCVLTGNQCHERGRRYEHTPIMLVNAATAIVGNNRIQGTPGDAIQVNVRSGAGGTPVATIVGNIVSGPISLDGVALQPPWAPLNILV